MSFFKKLAVSSLTCLILLCAACQPALKQAGLPATPTKIASGSSYITQTANESYSSPNLKDKCPSIITSSGLPDERFFGNVVISTQDENRLNHFSLLSLDTQTIKDITSTDEIGEYHSTVSPNHEWLAYEKWYRGDFAKRQLIITALDGKPEISIPWSDQWAFITYWLNNKQLVIKQNDKPNVLLYNPFTNVGEEISLEFADIYPFGDIWENNLNVAFSPDFTRLIYPRSREGITLLDLATKQPLMTISPIVIGTTPKWSPDGGHFVFVDLTSWETNQDQRLLIVLASRDGALKKFANISNRKVDNISYFSWSPNSRFIAYWVEYNQDNYLNIFDTQENTITNLCLTGDGVPVWPGARKVC